MVALRARARQPRRDAVTAHRNHGHRPCIAAGAPQSRSRINAHLRPVDPVGIVPVAGKLDQRIGRVDARFLGRGNRQAALDAETVELYLNIDSLEIDIGSPVGIVAARRSDNGLTIDADGNACFKPGITKRIAVLLQNRFLGGQQC